MVSADASVAVSEPPRKRQKKSPSPTPATTSNMDATAPSFESRKVKDAIGQAKVDEKVETGFQHKREEGVGILCFVNEENLGFEGVLKQRYTDFLVNEIMMNGEVAHLTDDRAPKINTNAINDTTQAPNSSEPVATAAEGVKDDFEIQAKDAILETEPPVAKELRLQDTGNTEKHEEPISISNDQHVVQASVSTTSKDTELPASISHEDRDKLITYFGTGFTQKIFEFYTRILSRPEAKAATFGSLISQPIKDKGLRGQLHQDVRRIFESRLETVATDESAIQFTATPRQKPNSGARSGAPNPRYHTERGQAKGRLGWQELGGEYLHFSLYKENKDTIEVINFISRQLHVKPKDFAFAGTKDRRAATVQRVSVFRQYAKNLTRLNPMLRGSRLGNFTYEKHGLQLGELRGNQFRITLRDCHFGDDAGFDDEARVQLAEKVVGQAVKHLQLHGFINYFGLQRFGTFGIGTDEIGKKILQGDFQGAVNAILTFSEDSLAAALDKEKRDSSDKIGRDDLDRAHAIHMFRTTGKGKDALEKMPRKFSGESAIIRHLSSYNTRGDYQGALMNVTRNLRTMYVHAYQSLVWNMVASKRWTKYGSKIIAGDLVLVENAGSKGADVAKPEEYDENGEIIVLPAADDVAVTHDDVYERARALTAEEAESGKYSIFDIVLPTPGFDIEYPSNNIGEFFKEFMASDRGGGLDPANMRRNQKDFSLSGSYRKLIAQTGKDMSFEIKIYHDDIEQLVETDLEKLEKSRPPGGNDSDQQKHNRHHDRSNYQNWSNQQNRGGYGDHGNFRGRASGRDRGFARGGGRHKSNDSNSRSSRTREWPDPPAGEAQLATQNSEQQAVTKEIFHQAEQQVKQDSELDGEKQNAINAWASLPAKLAADDKSAFEAYTEAKRNKPLVNPDDIKQPIYKETFIQTSAEDEGRRTGYRSTKMISYDSAGDQHDVHLPHMRGGAGTTMDVDVDDKPADSAANVSLVASEDLQDGGGVTLSHQSSPLKRSQKAIPTEDATGQSLPASALSAAVEATTSGDAPAEGLPIDSPAEDKPTKIAVIVKFDLGSSQYATMALRELMKAGGVKTYKPDFSSGR